MVTTRRSLGNHANNPDVPRKRRSLEDSSLPVKKLYPDLTETTSYASTIYTRTSEIADDEEEYETEADSSFESSRASEVPDNGMYPMWMYGLAVVVILLGVFVGLMVGGKNKHNEQADLNYEKYIKSVRSVISTQFPDASQDNRAILRLIGQKVYLEPENTSPLVILVGGTKARHFSEAISGIIRTLAAKHPQNTVGHGTIRVESETNRAELHEIVKRALSPPSSQPTSSPSPRTAVVLDVDLLKWDAVLVLHAFADHEKYPVPKTVLFLTVSAHNESSDENCDGKMVDFLTSRWIENGGSSDNIPPIIARISYFLCV